MGEHWATHPKKLIPFWTSSPRNISRASPGTKIQLRQWQTLTWTRILCGLKFVKSSRSLTMSLGLTSWRRKNDRRAHLLDVRANLSPLRTNQNQNQNKHQHPRRPNARHNICQFPKGTLMISWSRVTGGKPQYYT